MKAEVKAEDMFKLGRLTLARTGFTPVFRVLL
jgi:hypothetical protein